MVIPNVVFGEAGDMLVRCHPFGCFKMAVGILTKDTTLHNETKSITIPKGTIISFMGWRNGVPTIIFKGIDIRCEWHNGYWYAVVYGERLLLKFPDKNGKLPYPLCYFKGLEVKNA